MVDDWNWQEVRQGTLRAVADLKVSLLFGLEIRTTLGNSHPDINCQLSDWHNGYYVAVFQKENVLPLPRNLRALGEIWAGSPDT